MVFLANKLMPSQQQRFFAERRRASFLFDFYWQKKSPRKENLYLGYLSGE